MTEPIEVARTRSATVGRWLPTSGPAGRLVALGAVSLCLAAGYVLWRGVSLGSVLESVLIGGVGLSLLYSGRDLAESSLSPADRGRVVRISLATGAVFGVLACAVAVAWAVQRALGAKLPFMLAFATVLGVSVGARVGLYDARSEAELRTSRELNKLLRINQRVLRHNIRNELAIALGHADDLRERAGDPETERRLATVVDHLEDVIETSDRTRHVVEVWENDRRTAWDLSRLAYDRADTFRRRHPGAVVETDLVDDARIRAHPALETALDELLDNAYRHTTPGTPITVSTRRTDAAVVLEVADAGDGIADLDVRALGTEERPLAHARGLGLWLVYWVVERSGGTLAFGETDDGGTVVRLQFPSRASRASLASPIPLL